MARHQLITVDNRDDRTEFVNLIARLPPRVRLAWLLDCCKRAHSPNYQEIRPQVQQDTYDLVEKARWDSSADERLTQDVFQSTLYLSAQFKFDLAAALSRLVVLAKKHGRRFSWRTE